jgi:hypothetical protein
MKFGRAIPTAIRIMPTDSHGFIVDAGFATFACETSDSALSILGSYLKQPAVFIEDLRATRKDSSKGTKTPQQDTPDSVLVPPLPRLDSRN